MTIQELRESYPGKTFGSVEVIRDFKYLYDESNYNAENDWKRTEIGIEDLGWKIQLPHSCDEWVIGSPEGARIMIEELQEAIKYCESFN